MATTNFNISNNVVDNASFAVLRTNPKFTSNVKLVVDSSENLFLGSFKANKSLSRIEYQKFEIKPSGSYSADVSKFYGDLPLSERYFTWRKLSDLTAYTEYSAQYEDQYHYGAAFNATKLYDEQYKLLAPIWLDKKIPSHFVIWRVKDTDYSQTYAENIEGQNSRILEMLKNATIVKSYDLKRGSNLGDYLHNHIYAAGFPTAPISFNFDSDGTSTYNGIDIRKGGFTAKREYLTKDYLIVDQPEIFANEYLTQGFERNGIISANLINLEFMFDDTTASDYNIYRYFGLYVDAHDEGEFDIDKITKDSIYIKPDSYETYYDLTGTSLVDEDMLPNPSDLQTPTLNYIKDKTGNFHHIKNKTPFNSLRLPLSISDNIDKFTGYAPTDNVIEVLPQRPSFRGFIKLTITDTPTVNDRIFIADKTELKASKYNLGDYTILADPTLPAGRGESGRFSTQGTLNQIAIALASAIKQGELLTYKATVKDNSIIIEDTGAGYNRRRTALGIYKDNVTDFIQVDVGKQDDIGLTDSNPEIQSILLSNTVFADWDILTPIGGAREGAAFMINENELGDAKIGQWVKQKDLTQYAKVIEIVRDSYDTTLYRLILDKPMKVSNDNLLQPYELYRIKHGKFRAYNLKDFNFDFYDTSNSKLGDLSYENVQNEIKPENYFSRLTPILQADEIEEDVQLEEILSEYDRLGENQLKETAVTSRVVPTIMKFALKDASNARNLPYILNVNEAFGTDNMSPNITITSGRNPEYLNMEHFHFNRIPPYFYTNQTLTDLDSYTVFQEDSTGITIDQLKSTKVDYFAMYFNRNGLYDGTSEVWLDDKAKKLYSKFDLGSNASNPSSVFRGLRYIYKKRKEYEKASPTEFINSSEVNRYRFGVTLSYTYGEENSVTYNVVKNDIHQFICVVMTLTLSEGSKLSTLDRTGCYTLEDVVDFNDSIRDVEIPFLIRLGFDLNNISYPFTDGLNPLYASSTSVTDGSAKFTEYIKRNSEGNYSWIIFQDTLGDIYGMKVVDVINDTEVTISGKPLLFEVDVNDKPIGPAPGPIELDNLQSIPINTVYKYWEGGKGEFKNLLEEIVAYNFADRFNKFGNINYVTINEEGEFSNRFVLEVEDGTEIIKASLTTKESDPDRPRSYRLLSDEIGKVIKLRKDGGYFTQLRRMNGNYLPLFKDVITFGDIYASQKLIIPSKENVEANEVTFDDERSYLIYNRFNNMGIAFESYKLLQQPLSEYGFIKNAFYHKVNDENVKNLLKLSQTTDKLPLYPTVGEIAIDKKDLNVLKSKYSATYFTKNLPAGNSVTVHGTLSPVEVKSYLASTVMKVKDSYDITAYSSTQESSLEDLDYIRVNTLNKTSIHWVETESQIFADFYLPASIVDELLEDGIKNVFRQYVEPENSFGEKDTIDDDLRQYIISNIVNRFIIDRIEIYGLQGKNIGTEFVSVESPQQLTLNGFTSLTNYETQQYQNDGLSFRLIYNKKLGYQAKLKVYVKIQA